MNEPIDFDSIVQLARDSLEAGGKHAAQILGIDPPSIREEKTICGGVRLVVVWPDGEETNEATIERLQ